MRADGAGGGGASWTAPAEQLRRGDAPGKAFANARARRAEGFAGRFLVRGVALVGILRALCLWKAEVAEWAASGGGEETPTGLKALSTRCAASHGEPGNFLRPRKISYTSLHER